MDLMSLQQYVWMIRIRDYDENTRILHISLSLTVVGSALYYDIMFSMLKV